MTARPSWLPSTMLIQVALLVFFQSKEERRAGRVDERRERGSGRRIGLNLSWLAIQCRQIANLLLSAGGRSEGYRGIRRGDRIGSLKSHKKVTDRRHREKRDPDCAPILFRQQTSAITDLRRVAWRYNSHLLRSNPSGDDCRKYRAHRVH